MEQHYELTRTPPLPGGGCQILASDYWDEKDNSWVRTGQNLNGNLAALNQYKLCDDELFAKNVSLRNIDMNAIPDDINNFDFCWSSCAVEHLGNLELGKSFFENHLKVLKPGGIAVHTIEFNNSSNVDTIEEGDTVVFRKRDIEEIEKRLKKLGCEINCQFESGENEGDLFVDQPPYYLINPKYHLHLNIDGYDCTSYGLVIKKSTR